VSAPWDQPYLSTPRLLTTPRETLKQANQQFVDVLVALSPEIGAAANAVNEFARILRERDAASFDNWLTVAKVTALRGFVTGIVDVEAVRATLSPPWSNGPVEGQVNRLKMLKRQMYGRAKFDLLRSHVVHAA
jgi:transposase